MKIKPILLILIVVSSILAVAACTAQSPSAAPQPSEVPTMQVTPVTTETFVTTDTAIPSVTPLEPVYITAFCTMIGKDVKTIIPQGTPVILTWGWEAKTQSQLDDFVQNNITTITLDGKVLDGTLNSNVTQNEKSGQPEVAWFSNVGVLDVGEHWITYDVKWRKMIEDGTSSYGPGSKNETLHDECQIIVESTSNPISTPTNQILKTSMGDFEIISARLATEVRDSVAPPDSRFLLISLTGADGKKLAIGEFSLESFQTMVNDTHDQIYISDGKGGQSRYSQMGGWLDDDFVIGFTVPVGETYTLYWPGNDPIPLTIVE